MGHITRRKFIELAASFGACQSMTSGFFGFDATIVGPNIVLNLSKMAGKAGFDRVESFFCTE
ncbi:MAG TPA: hypothetical protein VGJ66_21380 [Pyrinomonadaceae bacterium]|jgi:hypothetical protein